MNAESYLEDFKAWEKVNFKGKRSATDCTDFTKVLLLRGTRMGASGHPFHPGLAGKRVSMGVINSNHIVKRVPARPWGKGCSAERWPMRGF